MKKNMKKHKKKRKNMKTDNAAYAIAMITL